MAGVNSRFATIIEAEILKIREDSVPENTKKVTKSVVEITEWVYTKTIILFSLGDNGGIFNSPLRGSVNILSLFTSVSKNKC